jgi:hypothetical protein
MDERTEELRDLFESVTGTGTVTERQDESRGSLATDTDPKAAIEATIEDLRSSLSVETPFSTPALVTIVEGFYAGQTDAELAAAVEAERDAGTADSADPGPDDSVEEATVARARLDLHLVREADRPDEDAISTLREVEAGAESVRSAAATLDRPESTIERWLAVRETQAERRRVADRYRQAFESALSDRDIADRLTGSLEATGLDESLADQEVDVDL